MSTVLEKLKLYFQKNSNEQIKKDWAESEKYDKIGTTVEEFMEQTVFQHEIEFQEEFWTFNSFNKMTENPKFASDFFLNLA